jgi:hypothetical protein
MWLLLAVLASTPLENAKLHAYGTPGTGLVASDKKQRHGIVFFS